MTDLRKLARGQRCMVRLEHCTGGGADTVLAHYRMAGTSGMGLKPSDLCGAWCCSVCHDLVDGRRKSGISLADRKVAHLEGVMRTLAEYDKMGLVLR